MAGLFIAACVALAAPHGERQVRPEPKQERPTRRLARFGGEIDVLPRATFVARFGKDGQIPTSIESIRLLVRQMQARTTRVAMDECGVVDLDRLYSALQNPDIPEVEIGHIDASFADTKPTFARTLVSGHFKLKYTDIDPNPAHNTTEAKVKVLAGVLNDAWTDYEANFRAPTHYLDQDGNEWIDIEIYDIPGSAAAQTQRTWRRIEIDKAKVMDSAVKIYTTPVHELFHRVQYAYGLTSGATNVYWATEGTAAWAQKHRAPHIGDYMERIDQGLLSPDKALTSRKYDACSFWVFVGQRAGSEKTFVKKVWSQFESNGHNMVLAVNDTIKEMFGSPYTLEHLGNEWAFTNFIKDLVGQPAYFDYAEDETATGWGYGPLKSVPRTSKSLAKGGAASSVAGSVSPYGADYYVYSLSGRPTKIEVDVVAKSGFSYNVILYKGTQVVKYLRSPRGWNGNYSARETIDPTRVDRVAVIIVGNPVGGAYSLKARAR